MTKPLEGIRYVHVSLVVQDIGRSVDFLTNVLGFCVAFGPRTISTELGQMTNTDCGDCELVQLELNENNAMIELVQSSLETNPYRGATPHIAFEVRDLDEAIAKAEAVGAALLGKVTTFSEGRAVYMRDPGGVTVEFEELF